MRYSPRGLESGQGDTEDRGERQGEADDGVMRSGTGG